MKKILLLLCSIVVTVFVDAQNVGIGTATPQATLDVKGNQRFGGAIHFTTYDSISGKIEWKNSNLYVPVSQYLMQHSAAADGLYYNNSGGISGQLEYRNALGNPVFYTNFLTGNGYFKGRLGISTINPLAGLHLADSSVLFSAAGDIPGIQGILPQEGPGRRMFWYPVKAAFRAGYVNGAQWDNANIGTYSMATGFGTTASQGYSSALGFFSVASGVASTALGNQTTAKAFGSLSIGSLNDNTDNPDPFNPGSTDRIFQIGNGFGFFPGNAMTVLRSGNVGIGLTNPLVPLSLNGNLGDKISLWTDGTPTHYGFGIQSGLLQMFSKTSVDDIAFGYGSSTSFTERMRIKGNGNIGLGVADPAFRADVGGRIRIRTGNDGEAGTWLNKTDNTNFAAFIGLENDSYVGFYGGAAGWKFGMNTQTGALKINGSEGLAGQVLQSNGSATAPTWITSSGKTQYYRAAIPSTILTNASPDLEVVVPVNVAVTSIITLSVTATVSTANFAGCNVADLSISMEPTGGGGILDIAGRYKLTCGLTNQTISTGENPLALFNQNMQVFSPGANGVKLVFFKNSGPDITIGNIRPSTIVVKVVPL
ncbi:hypothetical protein [Ferruginibacter sp.]